MEINMDGLERAIDMVFHWKTFMWLAIGVAMGVAGGALPGLTAATSMALFLPLAFKLPTAEALGLLIGIYKGAVFGGSISAISFATPGTPEAAATVYDGYKLTLQGKGRKAILMALYASVTADLLSDFVLILVAPLLAVVALAFGPSEKVWLMILAIALLSALSGTHLAKGLLSAGVGFLCATIGTDPVGMVQRFTFGFWELQDGIHLIPLVVGLFAMGRMLEEALLMFKRSETTEGVRERIQEIFNKKSEGLSWKEFKSCWREIAIGFGLGSFVGALPGLGSTVGAFLSYSVAKQFQPHKKIGTGKLEGIAAAEAGNNATVGPTLIPLLAFGIPGSSSAALLGGMLTLHGFDPNPRMFELYPHAVYALFIILIIGNFFNLAIGRFFAMIFAKLALLPRSMLIPLVMLMAVLGSYAYQGNTTDVWVMLVFGFVGFFFRIWNIPEAPLIVTFLVAPLMESELRRGLIINQRDWFDTLFHSNLAIGLAVSAFILTALCVKFNVMEKIADAADREAKEQDDMKSK